MFIKWLVSGLEITGLGVTQEGKQAEVPDEVGTSLINEKIAKEVKIRQNTKEDKSSKEVIE